MPLFWSLSIKGCTSSSQVAHHHGSAAVALEGSPRAQSESGLDIDASERDMQIFSWHAELDYVIGLHLSRTPHRIFNLLPIADSVFWSRRTATLACRYRAAEQEH